VRTWSKMAEPRGNRRQRRLANKGGKRRIGAKAAVAVVSAAATVVWTAPGADPAAAAAPDYEFGAGPYNNIWVHSLSSQQCAGLPEHKLRALAMTIAYHETGATDGTKGPSPMTHSRSDNQASLDDPNHTQGFWHPGTGMYAFDWGAPFQVVSQWARMNADTSSAIVVPRVASLYCNASGTETQKLDAAWTSFGCVQTAAKFQNCLDTYNDIYDGTTLVNVTKDIGISSWGGVAPNSCEWTVGGFPFDCYQVDFSKSQGHDCYLAAGCGTNPVPVSYTAATNGKEIRQWSVWNGALLNHYSERGLNLDPRGALSWTNGKKICNVSIWGAACP
jgi:hypothetical protein